MSTLNESDSESFNELEIDFPFDAEDDIEITSPKRDVCNRCKRAAMTCICHHFPTTPYPITTTIHMLQHPREHDTRSMTTVPLLRECVPTEKCVMYVGKRFSERKFPDLHALCKQPNVYVLFPSGEAKDISAYSNSVKESNEFHLIVIDGTWKQAKQIYFNNKFLHPLTKVQISGDWKSTYVIRTQPNNSCLSTLEATAIAVAQLEQKPQLIDVVRRPLKALCDFQLSHGAVYHHSKEELFKHGIEYRVFTEANLQKLDYLRKETMNNYDYDKEAGVITNEM